MTGNRYLPASAALVVVFAAGLSACALPPTADECNKIESEGERNRCFHKMTVGRVSEDAAVGALGGAVLGGVAGVIIGGPRGAVPGALIGGASGAVAGGLYGAITSVEDLEAANTSLRDVISNYRREDEESKRRIAEIEREVSARNISYYNIYHAIEKAQDEISLLRRRISQKEETIITASQECYNASATHSYEMQAKIENMERQIHKLEETKNTNLQEIQRLNVVLKELNIAARGGRGTTIITPGS